jgi:exodeoxyribonuclease V beta subunit
VLQYHLYTVALHRFLTIKYGRDYDYETHFGGVFDIFLRGVSPDGKGEYGIFNDRPSPSLIKDLAGCLGMTAD